MSTEQNKSIVRRVIEEGWNRGNLAIFDELLSPTHIDHNPIPGQSPGVAGVKQNVSFYRAAFPDVRSTIEQQIAEGDRVVTRWTAMGVNSGSFMGAPPTGKAVTITGITINRVVGGKIVETWNNFDQLGMLQQLGMAPMPGQG